MLVCQQKDMKKRREANLYHMHYLIYRCLYILKIRDPNIDLAFIPGTFSVAPKFLKSTVCVSCTLHSWGIDFLSFELLTVIFKEFAIPGICKTVPTISLIQCVHLPETVMQRGGCHGVWETLKLPSTRSVFKGHHWISGIFVGNPEIQQVSFQP